MLALPQATGDALQDAAALLSLAELAENSEQRAPIIDRLNAMNVVLADGAGDNPPDNPLAQWREDHQASGNAPYRGRTLGPAYRRVHVQGGDSLQIDQIFYAGERAEIAAQANGGDIAIEINNPRDESVCAKPLAPNANCSWLPIFTERFSIQVENHGSQPASVYITFR